MSDTPKSVTGVDLDPVDGRPVFAEVNGVPMSRRRWLEATKDARQAALVADLRASTTDDGTLTDDAASVSSEFAPSQHPDPSELSHTDPDGSSLDEAGED